MIAFLIGVVHCFDVFDRGTELRPPVFVFAADLAGVEAVDKLDGRH